MITAVEVFFQPLTAGYYKAVLQNHIEQFRFQRSIFSFFKKSGDMFSVRKLWNFSLHNVPISIIRNLALLSLPGGDGELNMGEFGVLLGLGHLLSYPLTTIHKRLVCQSKNAGMIPIRYSGSVVINSEG